MIAVKHTFIVNTPFEWTVVSANKLEDWPKMIPTCNQIEILGREGYKTLFRFRNHDGQRWISSHFYRPGSHFAFTERYDPPAPLSAFHIIRTYRELDGQNTIVTDEVICQLRPGAEDLEEQIVNGVNEHALKTQPMVKAHIEVSYTQLESLGRSLT